MKFNELLSRLKSRDVTVSDQYGIYFIEKVQGKLTGILAGLLSCGEFEMIRPKIDALLSLALMPGMKAEDFAQIENEQISAAFEDLSGSRAVEIEEDYGELAANYDALQQEFIELQEIDAEREKLAQARAITLLDLRREFKRLKKASIRTAENAAELHKHVDALQEHMLKLSHRAETAEAALRVAEEKLAQFGLFTKAVARGRARSADGSLDIPQNTTTSVSGASVDPALIRGLGLFSGGKGGGASSVLSASASSLPLLVRNFKS